MMSILNDVHSDVDYENLCKAIEIATENGNGLVIIDAPTVMILEQQLESRGRSINMSNGVEIMENTHMQKIHLVNRGVKYTMKLAATVIRWICIVFNLVCLIITILDSTKVISVPMDTARIIMYAVYASWAIGIGTKFVTDKKQKEE